MLFFIYADDTNVIMSHHDLEQLVISIDNELSNLSLWFKVNKLSLNVSKSNYMLLLLLMLLLLFFRFVKVTVLMIILIFLLVKLTSPKFHTLSFLVFLLMNH